MLTSRVYFKLSVARLASSLCSSYVYMVRSRDVGGSGSGEWAVICLEYYEAKGSFKLLLVEGALIEDWPV